VGLLSRGSFGWEDRIDGGVLSELWRMLTRSPQAPAYAGIAAGIGAAGAAVPLAVSVAGKYLPKARLSTLPDPGTYRPPARPGLGDVLAKRGRYGRPSLQQQIVKTGTSELFRGVRSEIKSGIGAFRKSRKKPKAKATRRRRAEADAPVTLAKRATSRRRRASPGGESGQAFASRMKAARAASRRRRREERYEGEVPARRAVGRKRKARRRTA
jgi:hypothetical protein